MTCPDCAQQVPPLRFCIDCGHPLTGEGHAGRRGFAAGPHEPVRAIRPFTTLLPHLPRADIDVFRTAFGAGVVVVLILVALGFYPLALVGSAVLIPLLFILYFFVVDIYEGAPLRIVAATIVWGIVAGIIAGYVSRSLAVPSAAGSGIPLDRILRDGIAIPAFQAALVALGPLVLLRNRSLDDVLDGATFGAIAAAVFAGTTVLVRSFDLLRGGLRPGDEAYPWLIQVASIGVATPLLLAAAVGAVCGAFWLRYRAPVADRSALGPLGNPAIAVVAGLVLVCAGGIGRVLLGQLGGLAAVSLFAVVALLWLRATIHLGLREESAAWPAGDPTRCENCGHMTPSGAFCGHCGIALRALPLGGARPRRSKQAATPAAEATQP